MLKYGQITNISSGNSKSLIPRNLTFRQNDLFKSSVTTNITSSILESSNIQSIDISTNKSEFIFNYTDISNDFIINNFTNTNTFFELLLLIKGERMDLQSFGYSSKYYGSIFDINNNFIINLDKQYEHILFNDINPVITIDNNNLKIKLSRTINIKTAFITLYITKIITQ